MHSPEVVREILAAAREYASAIYRSDAAIDFGINAYRIFGPAKWETEDAQQRRKNFIASL
jgi:hypothetical protein